MQTRVSLIVIKITLLLSTPHLNLGHGGRGGGIQERLLQDSNAVAEMGRNTHKTIKNEHICETHLFDVLRRCSGRVSWSLCPRGVDRSG